MSQGKNIGLLVGVLVMIVGFSIGSAHDFTCESVGGLNEQITGQTQEITTLENERDALFDMIEPIADNAVGSNLSYLAVNMVDTARAYSMSYSLADGGSIAGLLGTVLGEVSIQAKVVRDRASFDEILYGRTFIIENATFDTEQQRTQHMQYVIDGYTLATDKVTLFDINENDDALILSTVTDILEIVQELEEKRLTLESLNERVAYSTGAECVRGGRSSSVKSLLLTTDSGEENETDVFDNNQSDQQQEQEKQEDPKTPSYSSIPLVSSSSQNTQEESGSDDNTDEEKGDEQISAPAYELGDDDMQKVERIVNVIQSIIPDLSDTQQQEFYDKLYRLEQDFLESGDQYKLALVRTLLAGLEEK